MNIFNHHPATVCKCGATHIKLINTDITGKHPEWHARCEQCGRTSIAGSANRFAEAFAWYDNQNIA